MDVKKNENLDFHGIFLKQKRMGATKNMEVSPKKFRIITRGLNKYFLEVSAHVSLKVATKGSFRGKKI